MRFDKARTSSVGVGDYELVKEKSNEEEEVIGRRVKTTIGHEIKTGYLDQAMALASAVPGPG